jgi:hypothetical protein
MSRWIVIFNALLGPLPSRRLTNRTTTVCPELDTQQGNPDRSWSLIAPAWLCSRVFGQVPFTGQKTGFGGPLSMFSNGAWLFVPIVAKPLNDSYVAPTLLR